MECLIRFLGNEYQRKLRNLAQCRSEKYEDEVEQYKKLFLKQLSYVKNACSNSKCTYYKSCALIKQQIVQEQMGRIEAFFDAVKDIYISWLDARVYDAYNNLNQLIDTYQIAGFSTRIQRSDIFFKGRVTSEYLTRWDMFHIPFNKRYLISNQRYSLTGQPIVYAGRSVIDLVEELGVSDFSDFKVSVVQLPGDIKIFDLRNKIIDDLTYLDVEILLDCGFCYKIGSFYKLLLASLCSFARRQNIEKFNFCEEYVIPQLLAQVIKNRNYDGIMYQSTKVFQSISFETKDGKRDENAEMFNDLSDYMENIAVFTKINHAHAYDHQLYSRITISTPLTMKMIDDISMEDLERIGDEIKRDGNKEKTMTSDAMIAAFKRVYNGMRYKGREYVKTDVGKMHLYHLYEVLHQILVS